MEFEKLIEERRSIRKYDSSRRATKEQITKDVGDILAKLRGIGAVEE